MLRADLRDGMEVECRSGYVTEYHGDVARFGEIARQYEGGPVWKTPWVRTTIGVSVPTARRGRRVPGCVHVHSARSDAGQDTGEFWAEIHDITEAEGGALVLMAEAQIMELRIPGETTREGGVPFQG